MKIERKYEFIVLNLIGIILLIFGIAAISNSLLLKNPTQIFWMCYVSLLILGTGILTRNTFLIMSQVYILAIPVIFWDIDFFYWLLFGKSLWGITDYFFLERSLNLGKIISLQHLFTVPLALYSAYLIGNNGRDGWKLSFVQATLVFIGVSLFTPREANINCVFNPCMNIYFGLPYKVTWFLIFFSMIFITALIINNLPFLKVKKNEHV